MAYFLRYTETPNADVERGYSYHWGFFSEKEATIEEAANHYATSDYNANGSISYVIIKGSYIGDCPEGDLIIAKEIVHTVKKEYFAE